MDGDLALLCVLCNENKMPVLKSNDCMITFSLQQYNPQSSKCCICNTVTEIIVMLRHWRQSRSTNFSLVHFLTHTPQLIGEGNWSGIYIVVCYNLG